MTNRRINRQTDRLGQTRIMMMMMMLTGMITTAWRWSALLATRSTFFRSSHPPSPLICRHVSGFINSPLLSFYSFAKFTKEYPSGLSRYVWFNSIQIPFRTFVGYILSTAKSTLRLSIIWRHLFSLFLRLRWRPRRSDAVLIVQRHLSRLSKAMCQKAACSPSWLSGQGSALIVWSCWSSATVWMNDRGLCLMRIW